MGVQRVLRLVSGLTIIAAHSTAASLTTSSRQHVGPAGRRGGDRRSIVGCKYLVAVEIVPGIFMLMHPLCDKGKRMPSRLSEMYTLPRLGCVCILPAECSMSSLQALTIYVCSGKKHELLVSRHDMVSVDITLRQPGCWRPDRAAEAR